MDVRYPSYNVHVPGPRLKSLVLSYPSLRVSRAEPRWNGSIGWEDTVSLTFSSVFLSLRSTISPSNTPISIPIPNPRVFFSPSYSVAVAVRAVEAVEGTSVQHRGRARDWVTSDGQVMYAPKDVAQDAQPSAQTILFEVK